MIDVRRAGVYLLVTFVCCGAIGCQLRRPNTTPYRMIEPQFLEPQLSDPPTQAKKTDDAIPVRLLDTQAREHIGRPLLHHQANGELTEDMTWRWSSSPDRYLDTALRLELASVSNLRPVDTGRAATLAATLLVWNMESTGTARLTGAVEFQVTGADRVVHTRVVEASEPVSAELPGDFAPAAGRLLRRLASEGLAYFASEH